MIHHLPILPILLPLIAGFILLALKPQGIKVQRIVSIAFVIALLVVSFIAFGHAHSISHTVYSLGNWEAPFGIVLVLDQFSIVMVFITALLSLGALWYSASEHIDNQGEHFHVLFQLQLFGINGAFLTGDLFNLFVFFEILLLASYSLLLHGQGKGRTKAGLHYVVINLVGSTLFLFAIGTLYGVLGTLNIADLALQISNLDTNDVSIVAGAGLLLLIVFGLKAAMFPLYFWLPNAYSKTSAPVAALFAIMTKVGIYSIVRVHGTLFGQTAEELSFYYTPWVLGIAIVTLVLATLGVLAANSLRTLIAYIVLASVSVLLVAIGINTQSSLDGMIYYIVHSTLSAGGFFLLADMLIKARGGVDSLSVQTAPFSHAIILGSIFFAFSIAAAGLPPLSGFFGKIMILSSALEHSSMWIIFATLILSSLFIVIALAKAGSTMFYNRLNEKSQISFPMKKSSLMAIILLLSVTPLMVVFAHPLTQISQDIATSILDTPSYIEAVLRISLENR